MSIEEMKRLIGMEVFYHFHLGVNVISFLSELKSINNNEYRVVMEFPNTVISIMKRDVKEIKEKIENGKIKVSIEI